MKMTYNTYAYLKNCLEEDMKRVHGEFNIAFHYLGGSTPEHKKAKAHVRQVYYDRINNILEMSNQLRYAAANSQGPNISDDEKEFWELDHL